MTEAVRGPAPRPRDAATLLVVRRRRGCVEVLMGERHHRHSVHPQRYVFPGGKVDSQDARVRVARPASDSVFELLTRRATPGRARALLGAAVRETFEESGLIVGTRDPDPGRPVPAAWRDFFAQGFAPDYSLLRYVARAVTPVGRPARFNVRFFLIEAHQLHGELAGNGELLNLQFVPISETAGVDMPNITRRILGYVGEITRTSFEYRSTTVPCFRYGGLDHRRIEE